MASPKSQQSLRLTAMRLLAGSETQSRLAANEVLSGDHWPALLELCRLWKVLPGLEIRMSEIGIAPPPGVRAELGQLNARAFVQSTLCIRAGAMAFSALEEARIPCAGFKGIATLAYLYPGPRSRTLQDVDLLVSPGNAEAAVAALEKIGFKRSMDMEWSDYLRFIRNSPGTAGNDAVSLTDDQGGAIDLHWRLGGVEIESLLAQVRRVQFLGRELPLIRPGHAMLLTAHHALRNDFVPDDMARDVCDFKKWQALLIHGGEWESIRGDAEKWYLQRTCLALAEIVARFHDRSSAQDPAGSRQPLPSSKADSRAASRLSALYFHQLQKGSLNTDLVYLTSHRPFLQVAAGATSGWKQYRDSMRKSEQIGGERSLSVPARLWQLLLSAMRLTPSQWRQFRTLAKAKNDMLGTMRNMKAKKDAL